MYDFTVYVHVHVGCMPSRCHQRLNKPLILPTMDISMGLTHSIIQYTLLYLFFFSCSTTVFTTSTVSEMSEMLLLLAKFTMLLDSLVMAWCRELSAQNATNIMMLQKRRKINGHYAQSAFMLRMHMYG